LLAVKALAIAAAAAAALHFPPAVFGVLFATPTTSNLTTWN
jgi:hypothetical protein